MASVQVSLQQLNTKCIALGDAVQPLHVRVQQVENIAQGADYQRQQDIGQLN